MRWLIAVVLFAQAAAGGKMTVSVESSLELEILIKDGNGETTRHLNVSRREKFAQETTAQAEGQPTAVKIKCLSSRVQKEGSFLVPSDQPSALHERSFTAVRTVAGWSVKSDDGNPVPGDGVALGSWNDAARVLSKAGVQANDAWTVDGATAAPLLYGQGLENAAGILRLRCESISEGKASISFTGALEGRGKDGSIVSMTVTSGLFVVDVAGGRPSTLNVTAAVESRREIIELYRKPGSLEDEKRKVGEITARSKRMQVAFQFQ